MTSKIILSGVNLDHTAPHAYFSLPLLPQVCRAIALLFFVGWTSYDICFSKCNILRSTSFLATRELIPQTVATVLTCPIWIRFRTPTYQIRVRTEQGAERRCSILSEQILIYDNGNFLHNSRYIPRRRVVHLDLKGAPPKLTYLKNLFPLFASAGATAILIEYEDMFPFKGDIRVAMISECNS